MDKTFYVIVTYFLVHLGLIFFMYPGDIIASTDQGHWLPILIGVATHIVLISLYMNGLKFFPKKDIIGIYTEAGKAMVFCFLIPTAFYFSVQIVLSIRAYSEIINIVFLSTTPLWAVMAALFLFSTILAYQGLEAIFRTGVLLSFIFIPLILFILVTALQNTDGYYIFPIWNDQYTFFKEASYYKSYFAIGGGFLFLGFVGPHFTFSKKKVLLTACCLIPFFFISVYIPILTFGQATASTFMFPFVLAVDSISINWVMFDRISMFFLMSLITFIMLFLSLTLCNLVRIIQASFPKIKYQKLVILLSVILFPICLVIPTWEDVTQLFQWNTFVRFYVILTVPLSIFFLSLRSRKKGEAQSV
ncbi:GerAB/ArcD/ProY family transporter [Sutcliffiella halmapala]|uniref:GerAB/ArcD/ProY family transporter n=1 Tax=Sutcliffiella halmapala TaxID=79882 RepID=UPI000995AF4A|nr:GerAB/ArcD/ProY family transporter [Sutcliffiella halmapala]